MNENEKPFDEELSELLWRTYQLKKKAKEIQNQKKSLPAWIINLLKSNKPLDN